MREAILYRKLKNGKVQCQVCAHRCIIANGQRGICHVRENQNGKLFNLTDNKIIACQVDPIEKKPFFHFLPGTYSLSIATVGCNFSCLNCQNWEISQQPKKTNKIFGDKILPEKIVKLALKLKVHSIAYTYNEPTIFLGYALEVMKLAHNAGLKNVWVSNGYFTKESLKLIEPYLDAINIDLKFFDDNLYQKICKARLQPVLDTLKLIKKTKIWLEITTLVIPGYTDTKSQFRKIARFIKKELDADIPCHISKFYPCYKMLNIPPTPTKLIEQAINIYKQEGLKYVYAGNLKIKKYE
ncbi:AmmeMemoRadiSam system radical SAM enzyme [Candidatus Parcubacteria bacterium 4484_255]|nr:MAG: AmmeMemoRadiSam system radical SAM enzyme [Candidatus Parcubacteria bacterium 4484_255]